jgi:predicted DNA-binding transcriptional regulator YafY
VALTEGIRAGGIVGWGGDKSDEHNPHVVTALDKLAIAVPEPISGYKEMMPWIRSWGAEVEVLGPLLVRKAIADEAAKMAATYAGIR